MLTFNEFCVKYGYYRENGDDHPLGYYKIPLSVIEEWYEKYLNNPNFTPRDMNHIK
jgi:hypothetical protein